MFVFIPVLRATTLSRPDSPEALQGNASVNLQPLQRLRSAVRAPPGLHETSLVYAMPRYQSVTCSSGSGPFHYLGVSP